MKRIIVMSAACLVFAIAACKVEKPGEVESAFVKSVKKTITIGGKDLKNPVAFSDEAVKTGGGHFQHHCQICHGLDGHATGVPFAAQMDPPVPDLSDPDVQGYTDGQIKWIMENGIAPSGMPSFKGILDDDEMWDIVHYIRHLPPKGSLGAPDVYNEEKEEHEKMQMGGKPGEKSAKPEKKDAHQHGSEHKH